MKRDIIKLGSKTAKSGFRNEEDAQDWLTVMNYDIEEIKNVEAVKVPGHHKADIQVKVTITFKRALGIENLSLKLVTTSTGFNQIDKREIEKYVEMWNIPAEIEKALKLFTGKKRSTLKNLKDSRRMLLTEMSQKIQNSIVDFFTQNKILIVTDLLKGNDEFSADRFMVVWKQDGKNPLWLIRDINV
jgi:hypothetical protein